MEKRIESMIPASVLRNTQIRQTFANINDVKDLSRVHQDAVAKIYRLGNELLDYITDYAIIFDRLVQTDGGSCLVGNFEEEGFTDKDGVVALDLLNNHFDVEHNDFLLSEPTEEPGVYFGASDIKVMLETFLELHDLD